MQYSGLKTEEALSVLPQGLRGALLREFDEIETNYLESRWSSSELSGGRFSEVVFTILDGYAKGAYPDLPSKPSNFAQACRNLENQTALPRSFRILIPRMLPALYEIRNNRNVGHVGGDVDPDRMDSSVVVSMCSWILAELIRVLHNTSTEQAQRLVDQVVEYRNPIVWKGVDVRRVLSPGMPFADQVLILLASAGGAASSQDLFQWVEHGNRGNFNKILRRLHSERLIEFEGGNGSVEILPPGKQAAFGLLQS